MNLETLNISEFQSLRYRWGGASKQITIELKKIELVSVKLEFAADSPGTVWSRTWAPAPKAALEVQEWLATEELPVLTQAGDNHLLIFHHERTSELMWSTEKEPSFLAKLRNGVFAAAHVTYLESLAHLIRGHDLVNKGQPKESAIELKKGIDLLGYSYSARHVLDDTGFRKGLGESEWMKGNWERAAYFFERVLEDRTMLYATRDGLPLEPVESPLP